MHRRDLIRLLGASAALPFLPRTADAALAFGQRVHLGAGANGSRVLAPDQDALVAAIAELILPRTNTPGALDAGVPAFIDHLLSAWYPADERTQLLAGFAAIDREAGGSFVALPAAQQVALLGRLDTTTGPAGSAPWAVRRLKSLTVYGYFTAEIVVKQVLHTPIIPGRFDGCLPAS